MTKTTPPSDIFSATPNMPLLAQAHRVYESASHFGLAKTQTRSEVSLTKHKWFRQKGTGRARHGAKSAPIFVGGGVAHGPRPVKRVLMLNQKMRRLALISALSLKYQASQVTFIDDISSVAKTKDAHALLSKSTSKKTVILSDDNYKTHKRFFKNLENTKVLSYKDLNVFVALESTNLVFDNSIFATKTVKAEKTEKITKTKKS